MKFSVSMRPSSRFTGRSPRFKGILVLSLIFLFPGVSEAQQSVPSRKNATQTPKIQSHFPEVEELLRQGLIEQAKEKIQEELQRNPSSVEAYNLLGIIYRDQKDYANALEAFQHALKLDPNSTRTRKGHCAAAGNVRDSLQSWTDLSSGWRIHESRAGTEAGAEIETRFTRDAFSASASLRGSDESSRCSGSAGSCTQAGSPEYGHHLSPGAGQHVAELF